MKISEVMTPNPRSVGPEEEIQIAARIMREEDAGSVPVVEDGRLVGMVTDRDIVVRAVADGDFACSVDDIMSDDVVTADPEMTTAAASQLMSEHQIRRLPVVDADDRLVGIVSIGDVAQRETRAAVKAVKGATRPGGSHQQ